MEIYIERFDGFWQEYILQMGIFKVSASLLSIIRLLFSLQIVYWGYSWENSRLEIASFVLSWIFELVILRDFLYLYCYRVGFGKKIVLEGRGYLGFWRVGMIGITNLERVLHLYKIEENNFSIIWWIIIMCNKKLELNQQNPFIIFSDRKFYYY